MAFEGLSDKLNTVFKNLRGKGRVSEEDIRLAMREVRMALLEADVSYKVVKDFVATVSEKAMGHQDRQRRADAAHGRRQRAADLFLPVAQRHHDGGLAGRR